MTEASKAADLAERLECLIAVTVEARGVLRDYVHAAGEVDERDAALLDRMSAAIAKARGEA